MESTSIKNMIQVTSDTAILLKESGKGHTLIAREGLVKAKGKGYMQTFWLRPKTASASSASSTFSENLDALQASQHEVDHIHSRAQHDVARAELGLPSFSHQHSTKPSKYSHIAMYRELGHSWNDTGFSNVCRQGQQEGLRRLIKWNTAVLESILTKVVIQRNERRKRSMLKSSKSNSDEGSLRNLLKSSKSSGRHDESVMFHEEIAASVDMPRFDREAMSAACLMPPKEKVNLIPPKARAELRAYVARIASMYRDVHFHR